MTTPDNVDGFLATVERTTAQKDWPLCGWACLVALLLTVGATPQPKNTSHFRPRFWPDAVCP